jgi:hypothetical protein
MKPVKDKWTIIIPGFWNRMIFTGSWVGQKLFGAEELDIRVPFMPRAPIVYIHKDIVLGISEESLFVNSKTATLASMEEAESIACKILTELPHTPISAIGVNFAYEESAPPGHILSLFNIADEAEIDAIGWGLSNTTIVRKLTREGKTLNLILSYENGPVSIHGNFHCDVTDAITAKTAIQGQTRPLHDLLLSILTTAYKLTIDEEDEDAGTNNGLAQVNS